jgi:hypothetical protein
MLHLLQLIDRHLTVRACVCAWQAFSWEPFLNFDLAAGEQEEWSIAYSFGESSRM